MFNVALGVTGSIAAYKAPEITRLLTKNGCAVSPILTEHAKKFVTEETLFTLSGNKLLDDSSYYSSETTHLTIENNCHCLLVAPATANAIAKFAHGIADDALSSTFLAFTGIKIIVPAMHYQMFANPIVQENILKLKRHGVFVLGPENGDLACGDIGFGRMVSPELISLFVDVIKHKYKLLKGKKILISAGGSVERIDNMRVITNLSTGMLGERLAHAASFLGADVTLVSTKKLIVNNPHLKVVPVMSVFDMKEALESHIKHNDVLYMAAAVSDFTCKASNKKIKREGNISLDLQKTPDILKSLSKYKLNKLFVGFCLEDDNLEKVAKEKLVKKGVDYVIANKSNTIGSNERSVKIISASNNNIQKIENASLTEVVISLLNIIS